jgi:hypothetical protein
MLHNTELFDKISRSVSAFQGQIQVVNHDEPQALFNFTADSLPLADKQAIDDASIDELNIRHGDRISEHDGDRGSSAAECVGL